MTNSCAEPLRWFTKVTDVLAGIFTELALGREEAPIPRTAQPPVKVTVGDAALAASGAISAPAMAAKVSDATILGRDNTRIAETPQVDVGTAPDVSTSDAL
ncbi:hypothetical protein [Rugosimonospora acidiphila]|uniref:hypothetical protein n=1 Tax=Rugosimonospora acidiphila TaxID=556531 RepID=UPI0031EF2AE6